MNRLVVVLTIGMLFAATGCEELGTTSQPNKDVERLSAEVEQLSVEVERLAEQQQQTAQLLETASKPTFEPTAEPTPMAESTPTPEAEKAGPDSLDPIVFNCPVRSPHQQSVDRLRDIKDDALEHSITAKVAELVGRHYEGSQVTGAELVFKSGSSVYYYNEDNVLALEEKESGGLGLWVDMEAATVVHKERTDSFSALLEVHEYPYQNPGHCYVCIRGRRAREASKKGQIFAVWDFLGKSPAFTGCQESYGWP